MDPIQPSGAPPNPQSAIRIPHSGGEAERLRQTAQEFEGVFLSLLLKSMRGSVGSSGLFKESSGEQIYRDMFDQEVGRAMARAGGIGLAQMILRDQARRQAAAGGQAIGQAGTPGCRRANSPDCQKKPQGLQGEIRSPD